MTTITLPRAVVEQALEALRLAYEGRCWLDTVPDAMDALRAALAQQAEHFCDNNCTWLDHAAGCVRAEPAEPVAWRYQDARGNYRYRGYVQGFDKEYSLLKPVPLYTAPPQRLPLTEEEIPALAEKAWKPSVYYDVWALLGTDGLVALVRAVERAHGIKERP